jgi:hypothetical protein
MTDPEPHRLALVQRVDHERSRHCRSQVGLRQPQQRERLGVVVLPVDGIIRRMDNTTLSF